MFVKEITYKDFNGQELTEKFYFHYSTPEATRMMTKYGGNIETYAKRLVENEDAEAMIAFIEDIILSAYGRKSPDGKSFIKRQEFREAFEYSNAYAELFEEFLTNEEKLQEFASQFSSTEVKTISEPKKKK